MNSVPSTFTGTLQVQPKGASTNGLYTVMLNLGEKYGMKSYGDGPTDGHQWQVQIYCGKNYVGGGTTTRNGELVLFHAVVYGFKDPADYERFKAEMLEAMKPYGTVTALEQKPPLSREELLKRGEHMNVDVTSQCGPKSTP